MFKMEPREWGGGGGGGGGRRLKRFMNAVKESMKVVGVI